MVQVASSTASRTADFDQSLSEMAQPGEALTGVTLGQWAEAEGEAGDIQSRMGEAEM